MPVVMNMSDPGARKPDQKSQPKGTTASTGGGFLSDLKARIALGAGVVVLVVVLSGWSFGWFGGGSPAPAASSTVPSLPATAAAPPAPDDTPSANTVPAAASNENDYPVEHKRNKEIDLDAIGKK